MSESQTPENSEPKDPIEVVGESFGFDTADSLNVPVHVGLYEERDDETDEKTGYFVLSADGYVPGKGRLEEDMFAVRSKDPEQLRQVVAERVVPLYEAALGSLRAMVDGTNNSLYVWNTPEQQIAITKVTELL